MADPYPGTLHDYFPRASGSNLLPVSPRRPHPPLSHAHADPYASSLAPRTEPYMPQFDVPKYLRHASLFKDRFATEVPPEEPSSSSSSSLSTSRFKGKAKQSSLGPPQGSVSSGVTTGGKTTAGPTGDPILLPTGWNPDDRCALLDLTSDALGVSFAGSAKNGDRDAAAVRANRPVPSQAGVYYFEVKILDKGVSGYIGIGLCQRTVSLSRLPGWEDKSYGYHADDGRAFCCQGTGEPFGPTFTTGDVVGCGIDWTDAGPPRGARERTGNRARDRERERERERDKDKDKAGAGAGGRVFFTKNGQFIGYAFCSLQGTLYPTVGLRTPNEAVRANFGAEPFAFDIESLVLERKRTVLSRLSQLPPPSTTSSPDHFLPSPASSSSAPIPALLPPSDSERLHETIQALVASYLTHHGYVDSAQAFLDQLKEERVERAQHLNGHADGVGASLQNPGGTAARADVETPAAAAQSSALRAEIRGAILSGTARGAQRAFDLVEQHFPALLDERAATAPVPGGEPDADVGFRVRCRVFVEAAVEWARANRDPAGVEPAAATEGGAGDAAMAGQSADGGGAGAAVGSDDDGALPFSLDAVLSLGQSLHSTYSADPRPAVREELQAVLGVMAYRDPEKEATGRTGELLQKHEREQLADELNKAVLRASGLPPVPALEALYRHASASLYTAADLGSGSAAMVDIRSHVLGR